jgi:Domain of unknown function (DUF4283)
MDEVIDRGGWLYRSEVVVVKAIGGPCDLQQQLVTHMKVWVQLHGIPPGSLTSAGILSLIEKVGQPMSDIKEVFTNGVRFNKVRVSLDIVTDLKKKIVASHRDTGKFIVYLVYERVQKVYLFCTSVGHDQENCLDILRLVKLLNDEKYKEQPGMASILEPKIGPWVQMLQ